MKLQDTKIATRLALGFAVMASLVAALGAVALYKVHGIQRQFEGVMDDAYPKIVLVGELKSINGEVGQAVRNLLIMSDPEDLQVQYDAIAASTTRAAAAVDKLSQALTDDEGKAAMAQVTTARAAYLKARATVMDMVRKGDVEEAKIILVNQMRPQQADYAQKLDALIHQHERRMDEAGHEVGAAVSSSQFAVAAVVLASFVLGGLLAAGIIRSITRPLHEAVRVARAVADGDLALSFEAGGRNETGLLLGALHDMKARLAEIAGSVRHNADSVALSSAHIAQGNSDLSSRTEQQASALQQTAASMEQLGSTVRQNSDNAQQANQLARGASEVAVQGGEAVGHVVETMKGINESSRRIAEIVGVIDGIAFQTNILALNAAVEAARAGEQGRGFAVVAGEVRHLASRSADAAREIKTLIAASVERVEQGSVLVDRAGTTMTEVVAAIRRVTDIVGEISEASREQSSGVAQVGEAVTQMDRTTQQNAALVQQSASAAESLRQQAQQLVAAVSVFKLARGAAPA